MQNADSNAFGSEFRTAEDEAVSLSFDAGVRGFTGLLVGLVIGVVTWGLVIIVWWLV